MALYSFNPFEMGGMNAVEGYSEVWLDSCCGHPEQRGVYHYHKYPVCLKSPFHDDGKLHSPVIGFAFDGFPVYGPYEADDVMARDLTGEQALDVCNGHSDDVRGYHYHVTPGDFHTFWAATPASLRLRIFRGPGRLQEGAIEDNTEGESHQPNVIASVRPGSAEPAEEACGNIDLIPNKANHHPCLMVNLTGFKLVRLKHCQSNAKEIASESKLRSHRMLLWAY